MSSPATPADPPPPARRARRWTTDRGRALLLPLGGMVSVVLLVGLSAAWPVDGQVVTAAVTGVITLAAATGGYAAGAARRH